MEVLECYVHTENLFLCYHKMNIYLSIARFGVNSSIFIEI